MSSAPNGFVGLGNMGLPMARHLLAGGHAMLGCDARDAVEAVRRAAGGDWAATAREIAERCEPAMVCLPTPAAVEQVASGLEGGSRLKVYVDLSTTGLAVARRITTRFATRGVVAVDAPVSGGVAGAEKRTLSVMLSGPRAARERVEPLMRTFGRKVFRIVDEAGMGQLLKLLDNLLSTTAPAATCVALAVGVKAGLDAQTTIDVLGKRSDASHAIESKVPQCLLPGRPTGFALDLSVEDVLPAVEAGAALGVPMRLGRVTREIGREALAGIGPREDHLQVVRPFEQAAGVSLQPRARGSSGQPQPGRWATRAG